MRKVVRYLFILLILFNIQPASAEPLTVSISRGAEQKMINTLELQKTPDNVSKYAIVRIDIEALRNKDFVREGSSLRMFNDFVTKDALTFTSVDNQQLTLVFDELDSSDPSGFMHWLGHVQDDPDSFVRLTFNRESLAVCRT